MQLQVDISTVKAKYYLYAELTMTKEESIFSETLYSGKNSLLSFELKIFLCLFFWALKSSFMHFILKKEGRIMVI